LRDLSEEAKTEYLESLKTDNETQQPESPVKVRESQKIKIACQQIASALWKLDKNISIADMVKRTEIQELGDGQRFVPEVVRRWLSEVAPSEVSARVGRRPNKTTTEDV
jgi:hypothetical protein